ncbi:ABC-F family ATP-binding cassette domain-containing protein [Actinopolymorpha alba]|uniref:ABC-F family ATP-binding cassette domain-containing protein n=1 Tax=Actinopolymorpha alba TaxID=533267 RepID=UPI000376E364|nr:ABC-F family ATP-binding cassette domain-containing protein [Actinopolymorpha alba]
MSWIRLVDISKRFDGHQILRNVHFRVGEGDKVGLIGPNGAGKTTVLNLILVRESPDSGTVDITEGISIGYFSQFSELSGDASVLEVLDALFADVHAVEKELADIETALGNVADDSTMSHLLARQAALFEQMEALGGWTYENQIDTVLSRLGFSAELRRLPISQLSGGWRNRAALARILLQAPDVLLMDEPTNYLDVDGLRWLEGWFQKFRGALVAVSHDRHFLNVVANRIAEVENYRLQEYEGNYGDYVRKKQFRLKTLEREFVHEEELLVYEQEALADRREAAKNPGRRLQRRLADIKKDVTPRPVDRIVTDIYNNLYVANDLCRVENVARSYDGRPIFEDVSLEIHRGDRLAIVGPNGSGKSTLLDLLAGIASPDSGRVVWSKGVGFAYYNRLLANLDPQDTVSHAVNALPDSLAFHSPRKKVNRFLSLFRFSELDLNQKIGTLSGGQQARVALAQCLLSGAAVVILDEPTNHLDITSTQVMERALVHFPGAVVVVSHDRYFIDKVCDRTLAFESGGRVREVAGAWS